LAGPELGLGGMWKVSQMTQTRSVVLAAQVRTAIGTPLVLTDQGVFP
jgi:hypothetical protein